MLVFLLRIRHDPSGDLGFDFEGVGWEAVRIPNPDDDPEAWTLERVRVPPNPWNIAVGDVTALPRDAWLYVFGTRELENGASHDVRLVRWPISSAAVGDLSAPEWWVGEQRGFVAQAELVEAPPPLFVDPQAQLSVHEDTDGRFVAVQSIGFGAATIGVRTARALTGPRSDVTEIWRPPESEREDTLVYNAKAHPELSTGDALAATYVANASGDFAALVADETLYYPRFVRLRLGR